MHHARDTELHLQYHVSRGKIYYSEACTLDSRIIVRYVCDAARLELKKKKKRKIELPVQVEKQWNFTSRVRAASTAARAH